MHMRGAAWALARPAGSDAVEQAFALTRVGSHQRGAFEFGAGFLEAAQFFQEFGAGAG